MTIQGMKAPMIRGAQGFVILTDDDLLESILQFFVGVYANFTGTAGECPWDHRNGSPAEGLRHKNIRAGLLEWYASVTSRRVAIYAGTHMRLTAIERYLKEPRSMFMRLHWRPVQQRRNERATDVEFPT